MLPFQSKMFLFFCFKKRTLPFASTAAARPLTHPNVTAAHSPMAGKYPQHPGPDTPRAAPPPAKTFGSAVPFARSTRPSPFTVSPPCV